MQNLIYLEPVDYLAIGHIAKDMTAKGPRLGGTAAYASLAAQALGLKVGVVTSWGADLPLGPLRSIPIASYPCEASTTFENVKTSAGRVQFIRNLASNLDFHMIPDPWRSAPIVHLAPVAQEVAPTLIRYFPGAFIGLTPQGWLREWSESGRVSASEWPEAAFLLQQAGAVVVSVEDVAGDEDRLEEMAGSTRVLAVTEAAQGARVYWNGDVRRFRAPDTEEVDATGAGDIFAAAFFIRLYHTRDPWEAGRFATLLASASVSRAGLEGIPTPQEIQACLMEVL